MTTRAASAARSVASAVPDAESPNASQSAPTPSTQTSKTTRPQIPHTQSAPILAADASDPATKSSQQSNAPTTTSTASTNPPERPAVLRAYTAHLPHNPGRPPPHTYQRAHEFPPFPPLAQHPVLPFLTTAFIEPREISSAPPPPKRPAIAPRASSSQRHVNSSISTIPTMDVSKNDPTAWFIRPPLVVPRTSEAEPGIDPASLNGAPVDGEPAAGTPLTYAILHTHRNWFLDAEYFSKDNPNRIEYPHDLEPPRGWAPLSECTGAGAANRCKQAKEKNAKNNAVRTKGSYAHGENAANDTTIEYGPSDDCHEKTILRCTFCRREYHGPNAKSMWRRHVFDKHKVPMKNRREGSAGMAPKIAAQAKKARAKAAAAAAAAGLSKNTLPPLGPPVDLDTPAPTLDLTNEQNIIRLLERVVSGNLDISLPASLLNASSSGNVAPGLNLEAIALALQKSGISLAVEGDAGTNSHPAPSFFRGNEGNPEPSKHANVKNRKREEQRRDKERQDMATSSSSSMTDDEDMAPPHAGPASNVAEEVADAIWPSEPEFSLSGTFSQSTSANSLSQFAGQKRKADDNKPMLTPASIDRTPLRDNTVIDRNNHNSTIPGTPRRDKGKQRALPSTPGAPKMSQGYISGSSPLSRNPYTPIRHPSTNALRSRALATTGEESYLTLIVSSPATESPIRGAGRVSFTSPFRHQTSPMKDSDRNGPPSSDDALGGLGASPRYPFEFNIRGTHNSPSYLSEFEPIPLEMGPAHWTPPSLGPPAPLSGTALRSISRPSSVGDDIDVDEKDGESSDEDQNMELEYPEWSPPSKLMQYHRLEARARDEDFDMEAFLDLEDAGPASEFNFTGSPQKIVGRGFSKEYGLLSPEEVERITASARPSFEEEARSSKRRRVEVIA